MSTGTGLAPMRRFRSLFEADPFRTFQHRINKLLEESFGPLARTEEGTALAAWTPSCDVYEMDNEIVVKADLPGVKKEDIKVSIENNVLSIVGERKFEQETKEENYYRMERSYGHFSRAFTLPSTVAVDKINAQMQNGTLKLTLPKREEAKAKKVEVNVQ